MAPATPEIALSFRLTGISILEFQVEDKPNRPRNPALQQVAGRLDGCLHLLGRGHALGLLPLFVWHRTIMAVTARRALLPIALDRGKECGLYVVWRARSLSAVSEANRRDTLGERR